MGLLERWDERNQRVLERQNMDRTGGIAEFEAGGVDYVIRVEPTGLVESPLPVLSFVALTFTTLRRLARRDRTWTVSVRRRGDDPFGAVAHREVLPSRDQASARAADLIATARTGKQPWA